MIPYTELPVEVRRQYFDFYSAIVSAYPSYSFKPLTETTFNPDFAPAVQYPCHGLALYTITGYLPEYPDGNFSYKPKGPKVQTTKVYHPEETFRYYTGSSALPMWSKTSSANCFCQSRGKAMPFIPRSWYTTPAQRALTSRG